jgi:uncharacterized iron-regulated membrane protein
MGLAVAMLSATGLIIWLRKRRARVLQAGKAAHDAHQHHAIFNK